VYRFLPRLQRPFSTLAGQALSSGSSDGIGSAARFYYLTAITADNAGNLYVADTNNHTTARLSPRPVR